MSVLLLLACAGGTDDSAGGSAPAWVPLDAPRLARRMSIDLRGVLPSPDELDRVEADPAALDALREDWLADPRFEERMVELYQERWGTRIDEFRGYYYDFDLTADDEYDFVRAIGEEPLRVAARVVASDLPYSELVTGDWTMADEMLAGVFPIDRPTGEDGWVQAHYTDLRPAAGVLTTNGLWWRYISPLNNYNRARTAAILDLLVCQDLLARPVVFDVALSSDADAAQEAIRTEPSCLACHAAVEPIAATLFGFLNIDDQSALEMAYYHPEREHQGPDTLGVETAWFGTPVDGLEDLGRAIAADGRFVDCGVQTVTEGLLRRDVDGDDAALLRDAREAFVDDGLRMKAVVRAVTDAEAYRAGGLTDAATELQAETHTTRRILLATQLRTVLADVAGLEWVRGGADQLDWDKAGFRVMGGGVDGELLTSPQQTPGLTWALLARRAAQVAATTLVDADLGASSPRVFTQVGRATAPGDAGFEEQLAALHWWLLARRADPATLTGLTDLWSAAAGVNGDPADGWSTVTAALLRDPDFLAY